MILVLTFLLLSLTACSGAGEFKVASLSSLQPNAPLGEDPSPAEPTPAVPDHSDNEPTWPGLSICSDLDFSKLEWDSSIEERYRDAFALALNVTGTFEGVSGWENLTGNFDGQGVSMGLLQWNLGQGSLQPIWNAMLSRYSSQFANSMTSSQMSSIRSMLNRWNSYASSSAVFKVEDYGYNELDDPEMIARDLGVPVEDILVATSALATKNQESVNWAKSNLLSGTKILSSWSGPLKSLAASAGYRSLQAEWALVLHRRSLGYMDTFGMSQVRSYLVFFDISVQNGYVLTSVTNEYFAWLKSNQGASEYTRMKKLIELRAARSNSRWQADVLSRKMTLLNGTGTVHGARRDIDEEYCTNIRELL